MSALSNVLTNFVVYVTTIPITGIGMRLGFIACAACEPDSKMVSNNDEVFCVRYDTRTVLDEL